MEENISREVVTMPAWGQSKLEGKIATINRRAVKLGCREMVLTFTGAEPKKVTHDRRTGYELALPQYIPMLNATLEYEIPKIDGYQVVAGMDLVETNDKTMVLISPVPGTSAPIEYHEKTSISCDHCGTARYRKHSILLKHDDGHYKEVGTTCVKDFFGHDPRGLLMMASIVFSDIVMSLEDPDQEWGRGGEMVLKLEDLLTMTAATIRTFGWLGRTKASELGGIASVDIAIHNMGSEEVDKELRVDKVLLEDYVKAGAAIAYFQDLDPGENDYLVNCCKIADIGFVPSRYQGYAASMVFSYDLHLQREAENANRLPSEWVGVIKERLKGIEVTVSFRRDLNTDFGVSHLYGFVDESGNEYKTFYSGSTWEAFADEKGVLAGTVKKHETYNDRKQTMLTRAAFQVAGEVA